MNLPASQRVLLLERFGGPEGFAVTDRPMPSPRPGEILVKVLAASVQFTDVLLRLGRYPDLKAKPPLVLGYDLVGEVVAVGADVHGVAIGQRVTDLTMVGSYAEYRTLRADQVTIVDPALDPGEVTTLVLSWMTAYQLLHRDAAVQPGQRLLVIGAAGAVGRALVVLAKVAGCEVWGTTRGQHAALVRELGATYVDGDQADLATLLPAGFDAVFDGAGEDGFARAWRAVGRRGHLAAYGFSAGVKADVSTVRIGWWLARLWWWDHLAGARTARFFSITKLRAQHPAWFVADLGVLLGMLGRGEIRPRVAERIGLDAVADAHTRLERGGLEGKIVLVPGR